MNALTNALGTQLVIDNQPATRRFAMVSDHPLLPDEADVEMKERVRRSRRRHKKSQGEPTPLVFAPPLFTYPSPTTTTNPFSS